MPRASDHARGAALCALWSWTYPSPKKPAWGACNGDGLVAINELIVGVSIALGAQPLDTGPSFAGADGQVGITDLIAAFNDALSGCSVGES